MRNIRYIALASLTAVLLSGCMREDGSITKDSIGSLLGAVAGGVIGSQFGSGTGQILATTLGTFAGSMVGSNIGKHLDEQDRKAMHAAANRALNAGVPSATTWSNPESGHTGSLRLVSAGGSEDGCRDMNHTASIDGKRISEIQRWCLAGSDEWQFKEVVPGSA